MHLLLRATSLAKTCAAKEETINNIIGENRGALNGSIACKPGSDSLRIGSAGHTNSDPRPTLFEYPAETREGNESTDILGCRYYGHPKLLLFDELFRNRATTNNRLSYILNPIF
jgi:hypothetical protein